MPIREWLAQVGFEQYADAFEENEVTVEDLHELTDDDLLALGVAKLMHRKKLLRAMASSPSLATTDTPPPTASTPTAAFPPNLAPADLPTYLAHPWSALYTETHPRIRLHWLVDTAELLVRWAVAVALAELVHAHGGLPDAVAAQIRDHIERPTLGRWLGILRALSDARPDAPLLAPAVFDLYAAELEPRFRQEKDDGSGGHLDDSLLVLRN